MFIELSYPIGPETTVLEASLRPPTVTARSRIAAGGHSNTSYIEVFAHAGTHIDAPWHFIEGGRQIMDFAIGEFVFSKVLLLDTPWHFIEGGRQIMDFAIGEFVFSKVLLLDTPAEAGQPIGVEALRPHEARLHGCEALLLRSGFSRYRVTDPAHYVEATPGLSIEAARYLAGFSGLRCVGVDFISVENVKKGRETGFPVHHALLGRQEPMILLEDADLDAAGQRPIARLYLFPLRMAGLEASPVTAVAEV